MSLFFTKEGKRKSPRILSYFFGALLLDVYKRQRDGLVVFVQAGARLIA